MAILYKREFEEGKRSFFQRVLEKDAMIGSHFVAVIAAIRRDSETGTTLITISDGSYSLKAIVKDSTDLATSEGQICRLIRQVKLFPGLKVRFVAQSLGPSKVQLEGVELSTDHYFLAESAKSELLLNYNGMSIAERGAKLG